MQEKLLDGEAAHRRERQRMERRDVRELARQAREVQQEEAVENEKKQAEQERHGAGTPALGRASPLEGGGCAAGRRVRGDHRASLASGAAEASAACSRSPRPAGAPNE